MPQAVTMGTKITNVLKESLSVLPISLLRALSTSRKSRWVRYFVAQAILKMRRCVNTMIVAGITKLLALRTVTNIWLPELFITRNLATPIPAMTREYAQIRMVALWAVTW